MTDSSGEGFAELGLRSELVEALTRLGYEEPTPIQRATIPTLLQGGDVVGQAATGTGKTAAFALPALERLASSARGPARDGDAPAVLILVPTRELAMQVSEATHKYGRGLGTRVLPLYGGQPIGRQLGVLRRGTDVVVATPGRALDHLRRGSLDLDSITTVVLDEADEMLDMGFAEDLDEILDATPADRQTVLFSATMPPRIESIARRHLHDSSHIQVDEAPGTHGDDEPRVRETAYIVRRAHKAAALGRILDVESPTATLVFCRTRLEVDELSETLNGRGYSAQALHGGMSQEQRDRVMGRVRSGASDLLVATDVAARGLDIDVLTHVVNYDVPSAPESYVHRIGRVGRAGRDGVAITLVDPREHRMLKNIERVTRRRMDVSQVPTVADLRSHRLEQTLASVREALGSEDLDRFRVVVDNLAEDFDAVEIALAALKLAHEATGSSLDDERDIPPAHFPKDRPRAERERGDSGRPRRDFDRPRGDAARGRNDNDRRRDYDRPRGDTDRGRNDRPRGERGPRRDVESGMTRLYVGAGRNAGIRPGDLVGAIAGETSLSGRDIGSIEITQNFSLVEVPSRAANEVIEAMSHTTLKGKRAQVRRERF